MKSSKSIASFAIPADLAAKTKDGDSACIVLEGKVVKGEGGLTFEATKATPFDEYKPKGPEEGKEPKPPKETMEDDEVGEGAPMPKPAPGKRSIRPKSKIPARIAAITGYPDTDQE
jgi:hypothetical protein